MHTDLIKATFTNLLFVIGVILLIVGFAQGTNTAVKSIAFEKYPLRAYDETRCETEFMYPTYPADAVSEKDIQVEQEQKEKRLQSCLKSIENQRNTKQVEDAVGSFTLFISGSVLVFIFKGFIFAKKTN